MTTNFSFSCELFRLRDTERWKIPRRRPIHERSFLFAPRRFSPFFRVKTKMLIFATIFGYGKISVRLCHKFLWIYRVCNSVADPGCLSQDVYPGSRISDPGSKNSNKREGWKKFVVIPFSVPQISQNCKLFYFWNAEKKFGPIFKELYNFLFKTLPLTLSSQKYGFGIRDPRPGIRKKPILDPGSRGQKGTGSQIRTCNTGL